jgi:hypothetical protein
VEHAVNSVLLDGLLAGVGEKEVQVALDDGLQIEEEIVCLNYKLVGSEDVHFCMRG